MLTDLFRQMIPLQGYTFFGEILVRGFRASFLIVLVIGIRFVLRKAPHWTHCALWLVVFAELIIPIKIESPFSAYSYISSSEPVEEYFEVQRDKEEMYVDSLEVPHYQDSQQEQIRKKTIHTSDTHIPDLISLWSMGVCVLLINAFGHYISLRIKIREAVPLRDNIWICDEVKSPFVLGLIKSRIYLSTSMEESQIEYVVAHEQAHLQRKDQWWKLIGYFVRCIYWMNPLVWIAYVLFCRDLEFACDEKVIRDYDMEEKKAYLTALLACSTQKKMVLARPLSFGEVGVKSRVKNVLNYRKPACWMIVIAVMACILVAVCFLTNPGTGDEDVMEHVVIGRGDILFGKYENYSIRIVMTEGRYYTWDESIAGGGIYDTNYEGKYIMEVVDDSGNVLHQISLNDNWGEERINFPGKFQICIRDYNNDQLPDFTIGTFGSSITNIFRLYSISESGKIVNIADDNGMESDEKCVSFFLKQKEGSTNLYTCIYDNVLGKEIEKEWIWNGDGKYIAGY